MALVTLWYSVALVHYLAPNTNVCQHMRFNTTMRHIQRVLIQRQANTSEIRRMVASKRDAGTK
jgi:hypothetical protein